MYFESFQAALSMNGHGLFVWSAYAITALVLTPLLVWPWSRKRRLLRELRGEQRRQSGSPSAAASTTDLEIS